MLLSLMLSTDVFDSVFALMRADVRVIDTVKKAALSRMLLDSIVSTSPGEKLDEKLAALTLPADFVERGSGRSTRIQLAD